MTGCRGWKTIADQELALALIVSVVVVAATTYLVGASDRATTAADSRNHLPALLGDDAVGREILIEHAGGLAVRLAKWKFIPASSEPKKSRPTNVELGNDPLPQLYDLDADPGETRNLADNQPEILDQLRKDLDEARRQR